MNSRRYIDPLAIYAIAILGMLVAIGAAIISGADASDRALLAARYTARAAFFAFAVVFVVTPLGRLRPKSVFADLLPYRRHIGLAFACVMAIHLVALSINIGIYRPRPLSAILPGSLIFALVLAMALTSTNRARRSMGQWWKRLHVVGLTAILIGFANGYIGRLFHPGYVATGAIFTPLLALIVGVRIYEVCTRRARSRQLGKVAV